MWTAIAAVGGAVLGSAIQARGARKAGDAQASAANAAAAEEGRQFDLNREDLAPYRQVGTSALGRVSEMLGLGPVLQNDQGYQAIYDRMVNDLDQRHRAQYGGLSVFDSPDSATRDIQLRQIERDARAEFEASRPPVASNDGVSGELNRRFTVGDFWADPVVKLGFDSGLKEGRTALDNSFGARGMRNSGARLKALTEFGQDYAGRSANDAYSRFYGDQDRTFNRLSGLAGTGQTATQNTAALGSASAGRVSDILTSAGNARGAAAIARGNAVAGGLNTVGNWWTQQNTLNRLFPQSQPRTMDWGSTGSFSGGGAYA
jgi:hypothetical protein